MGLPAKLLNAIGGHHAPVGGAAGVGVLNEQRAFGPAGLHENAQSLVGVILRPIALVPGRGVIDEDFHGQEGGEGLAPR